MVYAELPGGQHSFDLFHSIRFENVVDGIDAFVAWVISRPGQQTFAARTETAYVVSEAGPKVRVAQYLQPHPPLPLPPHPLPAKGWTCRINGDGLPEWIPPWWIDQDQRPQLNARIRRLHAQRRLGRRRPPTAA